MERTTRQSIKASEVLRMQEVADAGEAWINQVKQAFAQISFPSEESSMDAQKMIKSMGDLKFTDETGLKPEPEKMGAKATCPPMGTVVSVFSMEVLPDMQRFMDNLQSKITTIHAMIGKLETESKGHAVFKPAADQTLGQARTCLHAYAFETQMNSKRKQQRASTRLIADLKALSEDFNVSYRGFAELKAEASLNEDADKTEELPACMHGRGSGPCCSSNLHACVKTTPSTQTTHAKTFEGLPCHLWSCAGYHRMKSRAGCKSYWTTTERHGNKTLREASRLLIDSIIDSMDADRLQSLSAPGVHRASRTWQA